MKKLLLTLAMAFGAINSGFAADLYVNNSGQSGTYTTINLARAAASAGDRIFVSPLNFYAENLTITKSLTIAPTNSDSKIALSGNIAIQPVPNMEVTLIGIEMNGLSLSSVTSTATISNPAHLNMISCSVSNNSNLLVNALKIKVHDCKFSGYLWTKFIEATKTKFVDLVVDAEANQSATDSVRIIACWIRNFEWASRDYYLFLANSYLNNLNMRQIPSTLLSGKSSITNCYTVGTFNYVVYPAGTLDWSGLEIQNTRFANAYCNYFNNPIASASSNGKSSLLNSGFCFGDYFDATTDLWYWQNSGTVNATKAPNMTYCAVNAPFNNSRYGSYGSCSYYESFLPKENLTGVNQSDFVSSFHYNIGNTGVTITNNDPFDHAWIQQFSGYLENQGSPAANHVDLDLSRNDIGILGGSHSWLNYWYNETSTTGNAVIRWINLPSEIWPGQTVNLKAEAVHTN